MKWVGNRDPQLLKFDDSKAVRMATKEFFQKKSKATNAILLENDRIEKGQFRVFWRPGPENLGDYHSKHHPPEHNIAVQSKYLHVRKLRSLQGCVNVTIMASPIARHSPAVNPTKR